MRFSPTHFRRDINVWLALCCLEDVNDLLIIQSAKTSLSYEGEKEIVMTTRNNNDYTIIMYMYHQHICRIQMFLVI